MVELSVGISYPLAIIKTEAHCFLFSPAQIVLLTDGQASAAAESTISPLVLNVWAKHVSDPFISIDALEILEVGS